MSSSSTRGAFRNARSNLDDEDMQKKAELAKKTAEDKANDAAKEAKKKADAEAQKIKDELAAVIKHRDELETKVDLLQKAKLDLEESEKSLKQKISDLEAAKTKLDADLKSSEWSLSNYHRYLEEERTSHNKTKVEASYVKLGLPNNLHPEFAGIPVRIISVKFGQALDVGQESRTRCHTWEVGYKNGHVENQRFYLTRATKETPNDPDSGWWIQTWHDKKRLELADRNGQVRLSSTDYSANTGMGRAQQWYFGSSDHTPRGSYKIMNREFRTFMCAQTSGLEHNGDNIACYDSGKGGVNNLSWAIVPWSIDVTWENYRK